MGYILPVTNFQSIDYQNRNVEKKGNSYFIEKPFQAILDAQHEVIKINMINGLALLYWSEHQIELKQIE